MSKVADRQTAPGFWRPTPAIALLVAVGLLVAGGAIVLYGERSYRDQKTNEVSVQARILASTVTAALAFGDREAAQEYVDALKANSEVEAAGLYDVGGSLFAGYSRDRGATLPGRPPAGGPSLEAGRLTVVAPVTQGATKLGSVYLRTVTEPMARRLQRYGIVALLVTMTSLVVTVLGVAQAALRRANAELASRATDLAAANESLQTQIEKREMAEEALRQAQKMEAIGQLTGGVAHDFNNLLQVILGNVDTISRRASEGHDDIRRMANAAVRAAERGAKLTRQMLAFGRRQALAPKPIYVNGLVTHFSDLLNATLGETVTVETVLAPGAGRISADANQLENALLNLAVNARDAMPAGGTLTIETSNAQLDERYALSHDEVRPGQYVLIAVSDTGSGMTKEVIEKAFDPFFTTKDVGMGSGLGLSQVYGFMRQSGGHARIYSELDMGTTVKLYLPRLIGQEERAEVETHSQPTPVGGKNELILVVEDDDDVRAYTVDMLRELGYGVIEAPDGRKALRALEGEPGVRLLFTDVGLPGGLNGPELAIEARSRRPGLMVLFTSGYARSAILGRGTLDPDMELISKPFDLTTLAVEVRRALEREPSRVN